MNARDPKQTPRWWDQTDEGYELRRTYGVPGALDMIDMQVAALEGDIMARLWWREVGLSPLGRLRREIEDAYRHPYLPLAKYTRLPHKDVS